MGFILAVCLLAADQITKIILPNCLNWYQTVVIIPGILNISLVKNYGAAFGFFSGSLWLLIPIAFGFVVYLFVKRKTIAEIPYARWGAPLAGAGALGNALDRAFRGYVVDFIDVPFFSVFNIADIGITLGVVLLAFGFYFYERNQDNEDFED